MDKILTSEGGYPLHLDDIEDLQKTLGGLINALASAFGNGIISGCRMYAQDGSWYGEPGYISYKGNIYMAEGNILDLSSISDHLVLEQKAYWVLTEHKERRVVYEDGHEEPSRIRYRATLIASEETPALPYFRLPSSPLGQRLEDYIRELKTEVNHKFFPFTPPITPPTPPRGGIIFTEPDERLKPEIPK